MLSSADLQVVEEEPKNPFIQQQPTDESEEKKKKKKKKPFDNEVVVGLKESKRKLASFFSEKKKSIVSQLFYLAIFILVSAALIQLIEREQDWTYLDAVYFVVVTITTIGYGDYSPITEGGKCFTVVFASIGIGLSAFTVVAFANRIILEIEEMVTRRKLRKMKADLRASLKRRMTLARASIRLLQAVKMKGTMKNSTDSIGDDDTLSQYDETISEDTWSDISSVSDTLPEEEEHEPHHHHRTVTFSSDPTVPPTPPPSLASISGSDSTSTPSPDPTSTSTSTSTPTSTSPPPFTETEVVSADPSGVSILPKSVLATTHKKGISSLLLQAARSQKKEDEESLPLVVAADQNNSSSTSSATETGGRTEGGPETLLSPKQKPLAHLKTLTVQTGQSIKKQASKLAAVSEISVNELRWTHTEEMKVMIPLACFILFVGSLIFAETETEDGESWSYGDGLWFSYVTLTTIGYGDFSPNSQLGKVIVIFYSLAGLGFLSLLLGKLGIFFSEETTKRHEETQKLISRTLARYCPDSKVLMKKKKKIIKFMTREFEEVDSVAEKAWLFKQLSIHMDDLLLGDREMDLFSPRAEGEDE